MSQTVAANKQLDQLNQEERFKEIFDQYHRPIYFFLLRMTQNQTVAEDLTQETFIRAHKGLPGFRSESSISTWVYRIATNIGLDYLRSTSAKQEQSSISLDEDEIYREWLPDLNTDPPELVAAQSEMSECVQKFIRDLPPSYRAPLILSDLQGLTNREIAEVLEVPLSTVKIRLHRARKMLQAALRAGCDFTRDERNVLVCEEKKPSASRKENQ